MSTQKKSYLANQHDDTNVFINSRMNLMRKNPADSHRVNFGENLSKPRIPADFKYGIIAWK